MTRIATQFVFLYYVCTLYVQSELCTICREQKNEIKIEKKKCKLCIWNLLKWEWEKKLLRLPVTSSAETYFLSFFLFFLIRTFAICIFLHSLCAQWCDKKKSIEKPCSTTSDLFTKSNITYALYSETESLFELKIVWKHLFIDVRSFVLWTHFHVWQNADLLIGNVIICDFLFIEIGLRLIDVWSNSRIVYTPQPVYFFSPCSHS